MKMKSTTSALLAVLLTTALSAVGQEQPAQPAEDKDMYALSLEELMNIPISSASKKSEKVFDAPVSSYTITRAEIEKAGSTSIMEALRLSPGVIVREQSNGNYDIHIRGFDNILRRPSDYSKQNIVTLVMIDDRPVFNYGNGGTFWETLPVDLNDVERIEIVRGPSAPMFGPNAVSGVINIVTRKVDKATGTANVQYGTQNTLIANALAGNAAGKWSYQASANYQQRDRFDEQYYQGSTKQFVDGSALSPSFSDWFPHPDLAMKKWGVNANVGFKPKADAAFNLTVGTQSSEAQRNYLGFNSTKLNTMENNSAYANLSGKWNGLSVRASTLRSHENFNYGNRPNEYISNVQDVMAEYGINITDRITVTPGVSYNHVSFDDSDYHVEGTDQLSGFYNGKPSMNNVAGYVRSDIALTDKWRVLAGLRADKFSTHDAAYVAYEFATTYKLNERHLVRFVASRSNSGSFMGNNYLNYQIPVSPTARLVISGQENVALFTMRMLEVGYRAQLTKRLSFDIDVFRQVGDQFSAILTQSALARSFGSLPTSAEQIGTTFSINFLPSENLQIKPFVAFQKTETKDLPSSFGTAAFDPTLTYSDSKHESTPSAYGGFFINYKVSSKLYVNLNGYYFSAHHQYDSTDPNATDAVGFISGKVLVNAKVNYAVHKNINLYLNGRNILNQDSREVFGTDRTGAQLYAGASFNLN